MPISPGDRLCQFSGRPSDVLRWFCMPEIMVALPTGGRLKHRAQSCFFSRRPSLFEAMAVLSKVVIQPPCSLYELQVYLIDRYPGLATSPCRRPWATLDAVEIFGQSRASGGLQSEATAMLFL